MIVSRIFARGQILAKSGIISFKVNRRLGEEISRLAQELKVSKSFIGRRALSEFVRGKNG
jgi:hypothetical protein